MHLSIKLSVIAKMSKLDYIMIFLKNKFMNGSDRLWHKIRKLWLEAQVTVR